MGPIGAQEMIAIFVIALVLFGPKKLPELGRMLGKGLTEFRRAKNELKSTFESHLSELEKETQLTKPSSYSAPSYSSSEYSYTGTEYGHYDADYHSPSAVSEPSSSQPSIASATAPQDASAYRDNHSSHESSVTGASAVIGAVPRVNGVQPTVSGSVPVEENHSA